MKVLLRKDVESLGIVGDIVDVSSGYARNYLFPQSLATAPSKGAMRALAKERAQAEARRAHLLEERKAASERINGTEVTIVAAANQEGTLYGSVSAREIASALNAEGHPAVKPEHVKLAEPIRHLDSVAVAVRLGEGLEATVKVWVVRERAADEEEEAQAPGDEAADKGREVAESEAGARR